MTAILLKAFFETLYMVGVSTAIACMAGVPLGWVLFLCKTRWAGGYKTLGLIVNITRSFPFAILMIALIPVTKWVVGSSLGTTAAIVPLSVAAIPFLARMVEGAFQEVSQGLIEAVSLMGATPWQIFIKVLLSESLSLQIRNITTVAINIVGYSAMAGLIGGGGLGQVALQYGYQRFHTPTLVVTVVLLAFLVECIQWLGNRLANRTFHG